MAFMKIVTDRKAKLGRVENPIGFTTYELLKYLGLTDAGYHYEEVNQFLERMVSTTIKSEYAVYFHGTKKWAKDISTSSAAPCLQVRSCLTAPWRR